MRRLFKRWSDLLRRTRQTSSDQVVSLAQYNTYDARASFSYLLRRVRRGEQIVIAHGGFPIAMLVPYRGGYERRPGLIRAHVLVEDDASVTPTRSSPAASS